MHVTQIRWRGWYFTPDGLYCEAVAGGYIVPHREVIWDLMRAGF